jgi:hypothetical protein
MWVKLRLDQLSARCDAFAKAVEGAMDLALDYWLNGASAEAELVDPTTDAGKTHAAAILRHEIRLLGVQAALQADVEHMVIDLPPRFREPLRAEFQGLIHSLTGEPFGDRSGHTEPDKARAVISSGTRLVRIVREGRDEVSKLKNMLIYVTGMSNRASTSIAVVVGAAMLVHELFPCFVFAIAISVPSELAARGI